MLEAIVYTSNGALLIIAGLIAGQLRRATMRYNPTLYETKIAKETDLPSVTVCIPARNEAHALIDCLDKVVASTYGRLEIIVLDDDSKDRTSELIRSFAKEGVRFVSGAPLKSDWIGKNHALQLLLKEASGSYILFMDVDTRLSPEAIENSVRHMLTHHLSMLSVLPRREDGWRFSVIASPLRYFWELVFVSKHWPPAASNAWMIRRETLSNQLGGFEPFKQAVQLERKIAAQLIKTRQYGFLVGSESFGVAFEKKWHSQLKTSVRRLYPMFNSQILFALLALITLALIVSPSIVPLLLASQGFTNLGWYFVSSGIIYLLYACLYSAYARRVWRSGWLVAALLWPLIVVQEMILIIVSTVLYLGHAVHWKGRSIQPEAQS